MTALSLTNTLTNGTLADASKVQQDFTDIVTYVNGSVVRTDGTNAMAAALSLSGDPSADAHAVRRAYMNGAHVEATGGVSQTFTASVDTTLKFSTEVRDTHSAYVLSTGVFTAPTAGVYLVSFVPAFDQSETFLVRTQIKTTATTFNTGKYVPSALNNVNETSCFCCTMAVYCAAGDTILPQVNLSSTVTRTLNNPTLTIAWLHG